MDHIAIARIIVCCMISIPLIILSLLIITKIVAKLNKNIFEARYSTFEDQEKKMRSSLYTEIERKVAANIVFKRGLSRKQIWLDTHGNPLHLTPLLYYIMKIVPAFMVFLIIVFTNIYSIFTLLLLILSFFFVDLIYISRNAKDEREIHSDLQRIYNSLVLYSFSNIPFEQTLLSVHKRIKNKRLHDAIIDMAAEMITTKDLPTALRHFESKFKMLEIYSFTFTIEQGHETGLIREMLESKRKFLASSTVNRKNNETSNNDIKIVGVMILDTVAIAMLVIYSFLDNIMAGINIILK